MECREYDSQPIKAGCFFLTLRVYNVYPISVELLQLKKNGVCPQFSKIEPAFIRFFLLVLWGDEEE